MALSIEEILAGLTEPQRVAATCVDGPLLVLAGAGSGKTRTITRRIAYMVACGIPAWSILAITFTNKAAGEMRERVETLLKGSGAMGRGVTVATFHSLCARLLRQYAEAAGLSKSFSIFDTSDQQKAVKQAIKEIGLKEENFKASTVLSAISGAKNKLQSAGAYATAAGAFFEKNVARIYAKYELILQTNKAVDFDDLLLKVATLLRDNGEVRKELQERYQYVLIDEYQDTNHAQFVIAHMLCMNHKNICATGDPDQSIYGWRGANIQNILEFEQFYGNARVVLLEQNYRSTKTILKAASGLIANNTKRKKKDLWTENEEGPRIQMLVCNDEHHEAGEVVRRLKGMREKEGLKWGDMAIFYRVNSLSRVLEEALMKGGVPYQIARGTEFYARKEIKDVLSYLRVVANPEDSVSLERIINVPARALGETSVTKIATWGSAQGLGLLAACGRAGEIGDLTARAGNAAKKLAGMFGEWGELVAGRGDDLNHEGTKARREDSGKGQGSSFKVQGEGDLKHEGAGDDLNHEGTEARKDSAVGGEGFDPLFDVSLAEAMGDSEEVDLLEVDKDQDTSFRDDGGGAEAEAGGGVGAGAVGPGVSVRFLIERVLKDSGMEGDLKKQDSGEDGGTERLANVGELINVAVEFERQSAETGTGGTLLDFLQQVTLVSDVDRLKDAGGSVTLMTLHAAKGLEFPFVAMVGLEDGLIPHARAIGYSANPDEMEEERRLAFVGITRAMKTLVLSHARYRMVRGQTERTVESQFLAEMPEECFERLDLTTERELGSGSLGYRDEGGYGRRAQEMRNGGSAGRSYEAAQQRRENEAAAGEFRKGMLVRHAQFGMGRIEEITAAGTMTRVVVKFQGSGAAKNLILQYAKLERVDG